jgi:GNAT superfamily N-acetyltransferase
MIEQGPQAGRGKPLARSHDFIVCGSGPSGSEELHREQGFIYRIAQEEHAGAINRLLGASFFHEPMGQAIGLTEKDWYDFSAFFMRECTTNGLSVIAVPEGSPDELAGVFINRDFKASPPPGFPEALPRFTPLVDALASIDAEYEARRPGLQPGQVTDLWMVGVNQGGRYARKGIASTLFRVSVEHARQRGFQRCVVECTGHFSQRGALKCGFQERARVIYKDYRFEGRPVFASIPEPHVKFALYERVFSKT